MGKFLIVHPDELSQKWIDRLKDLGTDTLGIHSVGGGSAHEHLARMIESQKSDEVKALFDIATENGLNIEYELHAVSSPERAFREPSRVFQSRCKRRENYKR